MEIKDQNLSLLDIMLDETYSLQDKDHLSSDKLKKEVSDEPLSFWDNKGIYTFQLNLNKLNSCYELRISNFIIQIPVNFSFFKELYQHQQDLKSFHCYLDNQNNLDDLISVFKNYFKNLVGLAFITLMGKCYLTIFIQDDLYSPQEFLNWLRQMKK